jgi:hypothetical protein
MQALVPQSKRRRSEAVPVRLQQPAEATAGDEDPAAAEVERLTEAALEAEAAREAGGAVGEAEQQPAGVEDEQAGTADTEVNPVVTTRGSKHIPGVFGAIQRREQQRRAQREQHAARQQGQAASRRESVGADSQEDAHVKTELLEAGVMLPEEDDR